MKFTQEQIKDLQERRLLQVAEALLFVSAVIFGVHQALEDDGKVSIPESMKLAIDLAGPGIDAFRDLRSIPQEITDLSPSDVEVLGGVLYPAFSEFPSQKRDQVNTCIGVLVNVVNAVNSFRLPPVAHVVA